MTADFVRKTYMSHDEIRNVASVSLLILCYSWIRVSSYSQITQVILNNSSYNSSYSRITRDSDPTNDWGTRQAL